MSVLAALGFEAFAWPWAFALLPLPWLARRLLPPAQATPTEVLRVPFMERLDTVAIADRRPAAAPAPRWPWLMWALLCVALARPQATGPALQPPQSGRDLLLAVDLSGSMGEPDMLLGAMPVNRLVAAKAVIADFLERRQGDRIGLIVFGARAFALTPLTLDRDSVRQQLDDTVVGLAGRDTAIGDAIALAVKRLQPQPSGQRVLILLTDGVATPGTLDPLVAARMAQTAGVRIHTIAFGSEETALRVFGLPMPLPGVGATIDEATLRKVAALTGGRAYRARDTDQLAGIYAEIDRMEPVPRQGAVVRPRVERYPLPLALAIAVAGCALVIAGWRRGRR